MVRQRSLRSCCLITFALGIAGCKPARDAHPSDSPQAVASLRSLRWLEGTWRGAEAGKPPFFEGYQFVTDTLVRIRYFADSTLARASDSGSVYWARDTIFHEAGGGVWAATSVDSAGAAFAPLRNAGNSFTWRRRSPDAWQAVLRRRDGRATTYDLTRFPR
jgi:hypothetical protein